MPTVLRHRGMRVVINAPLREHGPAHVHVRNADGEVVIWIVGDPAYSVRRIRGMRDDGVAMAARLVDENREYLLARWKELHG